MRPSLSLQLIVTLFILSIIAKACFSLFFFFYFIPIFIFFLYCSLYHYSPNSKQWSSYNSSNIQPILSHTNPNSSTYPSHPYFSRSHSPIQPTPLSELRVLHLTQWFSTCTAVQPDFSYSFNFLPSLPWPTAVGIFPLLTAPLLPDPNDHLTRTYNTHALLPRPTSSYTPFADRPSQLFLFSRRFYLSCLLQTYNYTLFSCS